jgi:hypothetical protein
LSGTKIWLSRLARQKVDGGVVVMKNRIATNILSGLAVLMAFATAGPGLSAKELTYKHTETMQTNNPNLNLHRSNMFERNRNLNRGMVVHRRTLERPIVIHRVPSRNTVLLRRKTSNPVIIRRHVSRPVLIERKRMGTQLDRNQVLNRPSVIHSEHTRSL